ncbi:MAG: TetR/AcrR family transcriptional regulator [Actinomycetota bacterium]|nr:TetR/AcrR family transcriptional regulator [Actinomycetota bacterium]
MTHSSDIRFFREVVQGRRADILDAALAVFSERGYDAGSLREIANRVGVSEPALYRHFASKEALFVAIIEGFAERLRGEANALLDSARAPVLRDQLMAVFAQRRTAMAVYGPVLRTVLAATTYNPTFLGAYRANIVEPLCTRLTGTTERIDGEFDISCTPTQTAARVRVLMALFVGYFVTSIVLEDEADEAVAEAVMRIMGWSEAA